ncbi:hypothetical protein B0H10DRAFT_2435504 [Mycena sp. CBHHK59/15]|nr:hypothetical protein B0H10DRAFT_2435504 [Mycena sp. CBHHK59/15]
MSRYSGSRYSVNVDGKSAGTFNATKQAYTAQVALYHADRFPSPQSLASASSTPSATASPSPTAPARVGAAVGGAIAAIAALALIIFLLWFIHRQKRRARETNDIALNDKHYPPAGAGNFTVLNSANASIPNHVGGAPSAVGSEPMLGYLRDDQSQSSRPPALANPWPSGRRAFHTVNDDPFSGSGSDTESSLRSFVFTSGAAGSGAPPPLPPTVNVPLPPAAERMYVPGWEQDFGPLPPDYDQATEPYRPYRS